MRTHVLAGIMSLALVAAVVSCGGGYGDGVGFEPAAPHQHTAAAAPPNVILIVLDTARGDRVSANGYQRLTTPHIDALARDGITFRRAHSVAPWTLPSHMSMFTGLMPSQHGATWRAFATPEETEMDELALRSFAISEPERMLPAMLRELGYSTLGFSSNAWVSSRTGFAEGFDTFYEMWKERDALRKGYDDLPPHIRMARDVDQADAGMVLLRLRQHARDSGGLGEPFFLFFNFIDPHFPYSPPELWRNAFAADRALGDAIASFEFDEMAMVAGDRPVDPSRFSPFYDAEIAYTDFIVGRLLGWLRELGYYDESLIIVTSDHGEHLGEDGLFSHQLSVEEELLHIPLVVKLPGNAGAGTVIDDPLASNLDVYRTILSAAGATDIPAGTLSRDLAAKDGLGRSHLIAEYGYSVPYLRQHHEKYAAFEVDDHELVRHVVYDRAGRHLFVTPGGLTAPAPALAEESEERATARAILEAYLSTAADGGSLLAAVDSSLDPETIERLRTLGYIK